MRRFTLIELLVVIAIIANGVAWFLSAVNPATGRFAISARNRHHGGDFSPVAPGG